MPVLTAIPTELVETLHASAKKHKRELIAVAQEGSVVIYRWGAGMSGVLDSLADEGISHNSLAFSGNSELPMWRQALRFNHTGELVRLKGWSVDPIEQGITFDRLVPILAIQPKSEKHLMWAASDLLCGPVFEPNLLENSKRFKLRSFLTD